MADKGVMELQEAQYEGLKGVASATGAWRDLAWFLWARGDRGRLASLMRGGRLDTAGDRLFCRLLEEDRQLSSGDFSVIEGAGDAWIAWAGVNHFLRQGAMAEAVSVATFFLTHSADPFLLNQVLRFALYRGEGQVSRALIQKSLGAAPLQADVKAWERMLGRQASFPPPVLEVKPPARSVAFYIPVYNVAQYLGAAIEGLIGQSFPLHEIVVVDDGSTDDSIEIARRYPVRILSHEDNQGLAAARNTAIFNSSAEFLGAIDTDALPDARYAQHALLEFLAGGPDLALVGGRLIEAFQGAPADRWRAVNLCQDHGERRCYIAPPVDGDEAQQEAYLKASPIVFGANTLLRVEALRRIGGYDARYKTNAEDADLCVRLRVAGLHYAFTPHACARHQRRDDIVSLMRAIWAYDYPYLEAHGYFAGEAALPKLWGFRLRVIEDQFERNQQNGFEAGDALSIVILFGCMIRDVAELAAMGGLGRSRGAWCQQRLGDLLESGCNAEGAGRMAGLFGAWRIEGEGPPGVRAKGSVAALEGIFAQLESMLGDRAPALVKAGLWQE